MCARQLQALEAVGRTSVRKSCVASPTGFVGGSTVLRLHALRPQLKRDPLGGTQPTMQRLPELKPTPLRPRHPLVYGAGFFLFIALMAFMGRIGMFWVLLATTVAVVMAIGAIAIALRAR